ncbi:MAG: PIN domain-containing protein [Candidatus Bathyarchaeia archaeon]
MVFKELLPQKTGPIEGIADTGLIVIAHFKNPARDEAFNFLREALAWRRRILIPVSTIIGAYHIMTEYLGVSEVSACKALTKTLETRSPAFYEDISVDSALDALTYALAYGIESWDGYLICLARIHEAPVIYSVDRELARKVREVAVLNPIPANVFEKYNRWMEEKLNRRSKPSS